MERPVYHETLLAEKLRAADYDFSNMSEVQRAEVPRMSEAGVRADIIFGRLDVCL